MSQKHRYIVFMRLSYDKCTYTTYMHVKRVPYSWNPILHRASELVPSCIYMCWFVHIVDCFTLPPCLHPHHLSQYSSKTSSALKILICGYVPLNTIHQTHLLDACAVTRITNSRTLLAEPCCSYTRPWHSLHWGVQVQHQRTLPIT